MTVILIQLSDSDIENSEIIGSAPAGTTTQRRIRKHSQSRRGQHSLPVFNLAFILSHSYFVKQLLFPPHCVPSGFKMVHCRDRKGVFSDWEQLSLIYFLITQHFLFISLTLESDHTGSSGCFPPTPGDQSFSQVTMTLATRFIMFWVTPVGVRAPAGLFLGGVGGAGSWQSQGHHPVLGTEPRPPVHACAHTHIHKN